MKFQPLALIRARGDAGLTQVELANLADVTPNTVWYLEAGRRPYPNAKTVEKIAAVLKKPWTHFFAEVSQETEKKAVGQ